MISVPQVSKADKAVKAVTKALLKLKKDTEKSDSTSTLFDPPSKIIIKCICQNQASAKSNFAGWLRVPDCKLHGLMLWDPEENTKRQGLQGRLFKKDISFMIEIFKKNVESKVELLVSLAKIEKHYSSVYMMC